MRPVSPFLFRIPARRAVRGNRRGFTMVELLVVIGILLLVAAVTVSAVNMTLSGDRIRGAARQVQSYLEGARGRASYGGTTKGKGYQCGVRFIRDANNSSLITSMQFVEIDPANAPISSGTYSLARLDDNNDLIADGADVVRLVGTGGTNWYQKSQQGLIYDYQMILIDNRKYQIRTTRLSPTKEELLLATPYVGTLDVGVTVDTVVVVAVGPTYKILLPAQPMANQEPRVLGTGVVLDTTLSKGLGYFTSNSLPIDIMFSPRGTVVGPLAATGVVEFVVGDLEDSLKGAPLGWARWQASHIYTPGSTVMATNGDTSFFFTYAGTTNVTSGSTEPSWIKTLGSPTPDNMFDWTCVANPKRDRLIISLTPQTGKTAVHPVYIDPAGTSADPYRYAETGEVAAQ